jgi:hypothetical protein
MKAAQTRLAARHEAGLPVACRYQISAIYNAPAQFKTSSAAAQATAPARQLNEIT